MYGLTIRSLKFLLEANFYISVIIMIVVSIMSVTEPRFIFEFNEDLYGPIANNLRVMLIYLAITEVIICAYCFFSKKFRIFIVVGFFLILSIGSMRFYGSINNIEVDDKFLLFFLYTGLSHILFGIEHGLDNNNPFKECRKSGKQPD